MTDKVASYDGFEAVTITYFPDTYGGELRMARSVGETVAPGLAITPAVAELGTFQGKFTVTHTPTGNAIVRASGCIGCARRAAHRAMDSGIDWSQDGAAVVAVPGAREVAEAMREILRACAAVRDCT